MADPIEPVVETSEATPVVTEAPVAEVTPEATPVAEAPALSAREAAYRKFYEEGEVTPLEPAAPTAPDPTAQLASAIAELKGEIANLRQSGQTGAAQAAETKLKTFIDYLREGDVEGAEKYLTEKVKKELNYKESAPADEKGTVQNVMQLVNAETAIRSHVDKLRRENPDIAGENEQWVVMMTEKLFGAAQAAGKVTTIEDYIVAYKQALDVAVDKVKKSFLRSRAEGKDEATRRTQEVLSGSPLSPGSSPDRTVQTNRQDVTPKSVSDIVAERRKTIAQKTGYDF